MKKRILIPALLLLVLLCGCAGTANTQTAVSGIVCTTQQLANLTERVLDGTAAGDGTEIACVVTEPVSCLHDYTLSVRQMQLLENAAVVIESGMGLEDFMADALRARHLDVSFARQTAQLLQKGGFDVPQNIVSRDALLESVLRSVGREGGGA